MLEEYEWITFSTISHPFISHTLHPITTEFLEKRRRASCLQTILLELVVPRFQLNAEFKGSQEMCKSVQTRNIHRIKRALHVFFGQVAHPVGPGKPSCPLYPNILPWLAIDQHPGMDLHEHGIMKRSGIRCTVMCRPNT